MYYDSVYVKKLVPIAFLIEQYTEEYMITVFYI